MERRKSPRLAAKARPVYNETALKNNVIEETLPSAVSSIGSSKSVPESKYETGTNWVEGGIDSNIYFFGLIVVSPLLCQVLAFLTSDQMTAEPYLTTLLPTCYADLYGCFHNILLSGLTAGAPTWEAARFLLGFNIVALFLEVFIPGKEECGPETLTGHIPKYVDNGFRHCLVFSFLFYLGSNLGLANLYDFGIMYDVFFPCVTILNIFGLVFCVFLWYKGLHFPSTDDNGSSGSVLADYLWGTELYPRCFGLDLKRFVNCRFSMTFWQLAGLSFFYASYKKHGEIDWGLLFGAISQYLYLCKFFWWEMGYMRSIDIIVDRAGFTIQWGCLVYVPAVYTLHSRFLVKHTSGLSPYLAGAIFVVSLSGVVLNYLADAERDTFRAANGKVKVWGKDPVFIKAQYTVVDPKTGQRKQRQSLLLASGFWGVARHFQYLFELIAAWSWCILANPAKNGVIPLFYAAFLTALLINRAKRDEAKCQKKYGKYYDEYSKKVPYLIVPGVY